MVLPQTYFILNYHKQEYIEIKDICVLRKSHIMNNNEELHKRHIHKRPVLVIFS